MASCFKCGDKWRAQINVGGRRDSATFRTKREASAWGYQTEHKIRLEIEAEREIKKRLGVRDGNDSKLDIFNKQHPVSNGPGIYVLFNDGLVSYVGKSVNMLSRIASHSEKGRRFTHFHTIPCLPEELDEKEAYYIDLLGPYENRSMKIASYRDPKLQAMRFQKAEAEARAEQSESESAAP